ncbi:MAG: hypothetical protein HY958_09575 [Bacteroidia bacterium]|nr:hypothetical protein [Bacteroidia bacterium]
MIFKILFPVVFLLIGSYALTAQELIPLNNEYLNIFEKNASLPDYELHNSFKPIDKSKLLKKFNTDSVILINRTLDNKTISLFHRKLRYENFLIIDTGDFHLTIDPLFNFEVSKQKGYNKDLYNNTRGLIVQGDITKKLHFESRFYENQTFFNEYINDYITNNIIVPGQGFPKPFKRDSANTNGWDYAYATGYISYSPNEYFNFQFGHGKNFIGDGYRSLLLSDNSFNYPFLKITTTIWKLQYTNLFASFMDLTAPHSYESGFYKKFGTFHYLSWNIHKRVQIGFFEAIIWQNYQDSTGFQRGFDINYLNPVIFYRPVEFSLGSPDNALVGLNGKIKITDKLFLYGQLLIDDFDVAGLKKGKGYILEKYGFQGGLKAFDLFRIKNLNFQTEFNQVRPYVYAHKKPLQNYSHYGQPLAHPLGANFIESVSFLRYRLKDFLVELKFNYAMYGADTANSHWGNNIFLPDENAQLGYPSWGNKVLQGVQTTLMYKDFRLTYIVNPKTNLNVSIGISNRTQKAALSSKDDFFIYISVRTSLSNFYYDF